MCGHYGICLEGRVNQPHHERPAAVPEPYLEDRDRESEPAPQKGRKKRRRKVKGLTPEIFD